MIGEGQEVQRIPYFHLHENNKKSEIAKCLKIYGPVGCG